MKTLQTISGLLILILATSSWALMPPKYLNVKNWKNCVSTIEKGSAKFVCLPNAKPYYCSPSSWEMLTEQRLLGAC